MLLSLEVSDFVIVERVALEFAAGFTVLTGETGAGKSILVDALALVLGARADSAMVRQGCERADISALFALPSSADLAPAAPPALASPGDAHGAAEDDAAADAAWQGARGWLLEQGFSVEDDQVLVRRSIDAGGRSRSWINGRPATTQQLRALGGGLLDIHGQHAHQSLLRPTSQRVLLDAYAEAGTLAAEVAEAWRAWQGLERELAHWDQRAAAQASERETLAREAEELAAVALSANAWSELQAEQGRLAHAHSLLASAQWGVDRLAEGEADVLSTLHALGQRLSELEGIDATLGAPRALIEEAAIGLGEAAHVLRRYAHGIESDPERLAAVEDQMHRVMACARRYRLVPEGLQVRLAEVQARLAALESPATRDALLHARAAARADYQTHATRLTARRADAAAELGRVVTATIRELAMGEGAFSVQLLPLAGGSASGDQQIEFCLAAYAGQPPAPLARIASGGELSRVSLAVQTALSRVARVPTLVFDEVDTGIGGRVAEIVGRLLHEVAQRCQVMCVTHLPQVAACADHHVLVSKAGDGRGAPVSRIEPLSAGARVEEVARMLGGITLTDTSRQHARELLGARAAGAAGPQLTR